MTDAILLDVLYLSMLTGGDEALSARSALGPAVLELLKCSERAEDSAEESKPLMALYYTQQAPGCLEVSRLANAQMPKPNGRPNLDSLGLAEICDSAVEEAQRLFEQITGEEELFERVQDDADLGEDE